MITKCYKFSTNYRNFPRFFTENVTGANPVYRKYLSVIPFPTSFGEALRTFYTTNVSNFVHFVRCVQVSEFGGHLRGNMHLGGGGKIEFHEISPPPRCQNFCPPEFFSTHFFRNFFPDISNFFQTFKNCPGLPKMFLRPTKNVIFLATFHKFLHFCPSNSDISTTFGHFSQKSPLCWCGSYTHGSQRLMVSTEIIKNWGGAKWEGKK